MLKVSYLYQEVHNRCKNRTLPDPLLLHIKCVPLTYIYFSESGAILDLSSCISNCIEAPREKACESNGTDQPMHSILLCLLIAKIEKK